jgi:hypothetical protein
MQLPFAKMFDLQHITKEAGCISNCRFFYGTNICPLIRSGCVL